MMDMILKSLINYIKDNDYLIGIYEKSIYIYNYQEIINISKSEIKIKLTNKYIIIIGNDLYIKKMENKELYIEGNYKGINFL